MSIVKDVQYQNLPSALCELDHAYGPNVHILSNPYLMTLLASICSPSVRQPRVGHLLTILYQQLMGAVVTHELPRRIGEVPSRMGEHHPREGIYRGQLLEEDVPLVVVDIARAGMMPSQVIFEHLCQVLNPRNVRQDHLFMNRRANEEGEVVGIDFSGSKIGGGVEGATVLFPDPMGATGGSLAWAVDIYRKQGGASKFVAMHLIVTPEYLKHITTTQPDVVVYAVRLDRGLSAPDILQTRPGTRWDEERGLNDHQYIVPGGGGFGEVINNAYV